jgi:Tetratricopeptide repeat.
MQPDTQAWSQADAEGRALYEKADYRGAITRWLDALVSLEESGVNARSRAEALYKIGVCYGRMGDLEAQIRYLERSLEEHFTSQPPTLQADHAFRARCLCRLGEVYRSLEAYEFSADCYSSAAEIATRSNCEELAAECLIGWGQTAEAAGDIITALNIVNRAREIARRHAVLADLEARADEFIKQMLLAASEL